MPLKRRQYVQLVGQDSIVPEQIPGKKFLVTLVITQLGMHHLVKCAPLVMNVHFKIRLSGICVQMEHIH